MFGCLMFDGLEVIAKSRGKYLKKIVFLLSFVILTSRKKLKQKEIFLIAGYYK